MKRAFMYALCLACCMLQGCIWVQHMQHNANAESFSWGVRDGLVTAGKLPPGEHPEFTACLQAQYHKKYGAWALFTPKDIHQDRRSSLLRASFIFENRIKVHGWHSQESYGKYFAEIEDTLAGPADGQTTVPDDSRAIAKQAVQDFARIVFDTCGEYLPKEDRCTALNAVDLEPDWCPK